MIEAAEFATPYQRKLHSEYQQIHLKFFPRPPVFPKTIEPPVPLQVEPAPLPPVAVPPPPPIRAVEFTETTKRKHIIRRTVCKHYGVTLETLCSKRRTMSVVEPRHVFSYLMSRLTMASTPMIGKSVGGQDHTTIIHAIRRITVRVAADQAFAERVNMIEQQCKSEFGEYSRPRGCIGRYVLHGDVMEYLMIGWMWAANLNEYSAILIWPCGCNCVEPKP